jgi:NAD(P)-dependent dehydrogenase (short-subunit alcohol dehydrogenase family)
MRVNARGVFLGCKYSAQQFLKQEPRANGMRGWIVNLASMVSNIGMPGLSEFSTDIAKILSMNSYDLAGYTASKGAVAAMTRTIALDLAKKGVVANCIAPGCKYLSQPLSNTRLKYEQSHRPLCSTMRSAEPCQMLLRASKQQSQGEFSANQLIMRERQCILQVMMRGGLQVSR